MKSSIILPLLFVVVSCHIVHLALLSIAIMSFTPLVNSIMCVCMYICMCVCMYACVCMYVYMCVCMCLCMYICIQGVPGGKDLTSGECSLDQTIPI